MVTSENDSDEILTLDRMTVQKAVAFLSSKKRTLKLLAAGLRQSPE
jgi:hypothetical protein